jgi:hypothetical protein
VTVISHAVLPLSSPEQGEELMEIRNGLELNEAFPNEDAFITIVLIITLDPSLDWEEGNTTVEAFKPENCSRLVSGVEIETGDEDCVAK